MLVDAKLDVYFPGMEDAHYPELHVVLRAHHDCSGFIRSANGEIYKLQNMKNDPLPNADTFFEGFSDLVIWYHSSIDALRSKLSF